MKKLLFCFLILTNAVFAQSTLLSPKAVVLPNYPGAGAIVTAIPSPVNGMVVFNSTLQKISAFDGYTSSWQNVISSFHVDNGINPVLRIRNENTGAFSKAIWAETSSNGGGRAIYATSVNSNPGADTYGLVGENFSTNNFGYGVYGLHRGIGIGILGETLGAGIGVKGLSSFGYGVFGNSINGRGGSFTGGISGIEGVGGIIGVFGESENNTGVYGRSVNGTGGYFTGINALVTGNGKIGFGITPNLNIHERVDINGRVRIRHDSQSAGVWFNNASNTIADADGAFFGMQVATAGSEKAGIFIGGLWNLTVDRVGNTCVRGIVQSNGACTPSDYRYKKNISPLKNSLQNVLKISGVSYVYRHAEFPDKQFSDKKQIGFIAQDIEKLYPEMVFTDENSFKSVDYAKLTPVLVEAIKEQQKEIENLKLKTSRIDTLEEKIASLLTNYTKAP
jgi:hypothetical protein